MRADFGFILIGLGLTGVYLILSGKFPPKTGGQSTQPSTPTSGGSAGVSLQSALRLKVSNGGMR